MLQHVCIQIETFMKQKKKKKKEKKKKKQKKNKINRKSEIKDMEKYRNDLI